MGQRNCASGQTGRDWPVFLFLMLVLAGCNASSITKASDPRAGAGSPGPLPLAAAGPVIPQTPTLPQTTVDTTVPDTTGYAVLQVSARGNLQAVINKVSCNPNGTIVKIQRGATFFGGFVLPAKACAPGKWVIIRSDTVDSVLPAAGVRARPSDVPNMPTIVADQLNVPAFRAELGASQYRLMFLQIRPATSFSSMGSDAALVELGDGTQGGSQNTVVKQPHNIIVDRCLIRGYDTPAVGLRRGVELHCKNCALINSYISGIHQAGNGDTQAVGGWNSTGPWLIDNNYLEAAGENILIGGAGVTIPGAVPSDITITRNYFFKPFSWKVGDPSYAGTHWSVKNLLELKMGVRVLIEGNIFQNVWADAQIGEAMQCYSSNSDNNTAQAWCADVEFRYNKIIHAEGGFGGPTSNNGVYPVSNATTRIYIHDNLATEIGGGSGRYFIWGSNDLIGNTNGLEDSYFAHNTVITTTPVPSIWFSAEGKVAAGHMPFQRFAFHNNIIGTQGKGENANCKIGSNPTVDCWAGDGGSWFKNILYSHSCGGTSGYSKNGICLSPNTLAGVRFVDAVNGDYRLCTGHGNPSPLCNAASPGHNAATDGTDVGADIVTLNRKTVGAVRGVWP